MKRASIIALTLLSFSAAAGAQPAKSPEERAGELVDEGNRHYNVAEYTEAIAAYKEAYKLIPEPLLLWNLAQAYRLAKDCTNALTFYRNYVREAPGGQFRVMADQRIPEMEACAKKATPPVSTPPVGDTPVGDTPVGDTPVGDTPVGDTPVGDTAGGLVVPPLGGPGARGGASADDTGRGGTLRIAGFALTGAGALGLGAGVFFSLKARSLAGDAERECETSCTGTRLIELNEQGDAAERNATIGYIVGGVALAAGVATIVIASRRAERGTTVTLVPTPGGAAAAARWSF